jgi:hypothetical protein
MLDVRPSRMAEALTAAGLDPKSLPPIETLSPKQKLRVMKTFTEALGIGCADCHAGQDFAADTRRKRVAKRMYNEIVRVTALETGEPVYCDSCHQGALFTLDRRDKSKVTDFMSDVFVGKMKRVDGRDHDCGTCHGDPPDFKFLTTWKQAPAPDIVLASPPPTKGATSPAHATPTAAASVSSAAVVTPPPAPAPRPAARPAKSCGEKNNLCPLQSWMRQNVASAVAANDSAALAKALDRIAGMAPEGSWGSWVEMSKAAADAARNGDMPEARKSCQGCHNAYKAKWRETYRTRAVK